MVSSCTFAHLIPQSATFTSFRAPIPAISHVDLFDLRPENYEKCLKISNRFKTDSVFFLKKASIIRVSSVDKFLLKKFKTFNI